MSSLQFCTQENILYDTLQNEEKLNETNLTTQSLSAAEGRLHSALQGYFSRTAEYVKQTKDNSKQTALDDEVTLRPTFSPVDSQSRQQPQSATMFNNFSPTDGKPVSKFFKKFHCIEKEGSRSDMGSDAIVEQLVAEVLEMRNMAQLELGKVPSGLELNMFWLTHSISSKRKKAGPPFSGLHFDRSISPFDDPLLQQPSGGSRTGGRLPSILFSPDRSRLKAFFKGSQDSPTKEQRSPMRDNHRIANQEVTPMLATVAERPFATPSTPALSPERLIQRPHTMAPRQRSPPSKEVEFYRRDAIIISTSPNPRPDRRKSTQWSLFLDDRAESVLDLAMAGLTDSFWTDDRKNKLCAAAEKKFRRFQAPPSRRITMPNQIGGVKKEESVESELARAAKAISAKVQESTDAQDFEKALKKKEFPVRRDHRPEHLWNTRAMKLRGSSRGEAEEQHGSKWFLDQVRRSTGLPANLRTMRDPKAAATTAARNKNVSSACALPSPPMGSAAALATVGWGHVTPADAATTDEADPLDCQDQSLESSEVNEDDVTTIGGVSIGKRRGDHQEHHSEAPLTEAAPGKALSTASKESSITLQPVERTARGQAVSAALREYKRLYCQDITSRKYLDGKKKCSRDSKFRLLLPPPPLDSADGMVKQYLCSLETSIRNDLCIVDKTNESFHSRTKSHFHNHSLSNEQDTTQQRLNKILDESTLSRTRCLEQLKDKTDNDLVVWQDYSVKAAITEKDGDKKTFPVLLRVSDGGGPQSTKRWGSGPMVPYSATSFEQNIEGPSSYLNVFKKSSRKNQASVARALVSSLM